MLPHSYCHACGHLYDLDPEVWPKVCGRCDVVTYRNPTPAAFLVVETSDGGVVVIRRRFDPGAGLLALPGGYVEVGETWEQAAFREFEEETGRKVEGEVALGGVQLSSHGSTLLIFGHLKPKVLSQDFFGLPPTIEATEICVVYESMELAFTSHTKKLQQTLKVNAMQRTSGLL